MSPFLAIWIHPRRTMRDILDTDPTDRVILLALCLSITNAFLNVLVQSQGAELSLRAVFTAALVGGSIGGLIAIFLMGWLFGVSGRILGGTGSNLETRAAIAWSQVPALCAGMIWAIIYVVLRKVDIGSFVAETLLSMIYWITISVASLWSLVLMFGTLAEAHRFSVWRGFFAWLLGLFFITVPVAILAIILAIAFPAFMMTFGSKAPDQISSPSSELEEFEARLEQAQEISQTVERTIKRSTNVNLSVGEGVVRLTDGSTIEGQIMYEDDATIYVESQGTVINVGKDRVEEVVRGE